MMNEIVTPDEIFEEVNKSGFEVYRVRTLRSSSSTQDGAGEENGKKVVTLTEAGELLLKLLATCNRMNVFDKFEIDHEFVKGQGNTVDQYPILSVFQRLLMPTAVVADVTLAMDRKAKDYLVRRVSRNLTITIEGTEFEGEVLTPEQFKDAQTDLLRLMNRKVTEAAPLQKASRKVEVLDINLVKQVVTRSGDIDRVIYDVAAKDLKLWVVKDPGWYETRAYLEFPEESRHDAIVQWVSELRAAAGNQQAWRDTGTSKTEEVSNHDGSKS